MSYRMAARLGAATLAVALGWSSAQAHEGHDHGEAPKPAVTAAAPRGEAHSEAFELVAVARSGTLTVYLDRFASNETLGEAAIEVEGPSGPAALAAAPDGSYTLAAPWVAKGGRLDLVFTVTAGGEVEILPLTLDIPELAGAAAATMAGVSPGLLDELTARVRRWDPVLAGVASLAFLLGVIGTMLLRPRRLGPALAFVTLAVGLALCANAFAHEGHDHNEAREPAGTAVQVLGDDLARRLPDGTLFVPKPIQRILALRTVVTELAVLGRTVELPGRILPDPDASGVVQSSVGGRLSAPEGGFPRLGTRVAKGAVLAHVTPPVQAVDVSDMRQRQGELDQQIAIVAARVARYQRLAPSGAVAQTLLDESQLELAGLRDRRGALDGVRREPEALVAPVEGVIAESNAVAGQMATPGAAIFHVVDPARLWIEALSFQSVPRAEAATASLAGGRSLRLSYRGAGIADRNQSVPVQFVIEGDTAGLRVGQFVTVQAATDERAEGVALPRASVVRGSGGQDVVYEHAAAERFVARPVRVTPLDGDRVLVAAGLGAGKRVVTQGAELLDQIR